jgi:DNA repair photolyase
MLNQSKVDWPDHGTGLSVLYNCNHYRGCAHGCTYCYARKMSAKWSYGPKRWTDAFPVEGAVGSLERDLRTKAPGRVMFCSMTDPYQPIEESTGLSRRLLARLVDSQFHTLVITKSDLVRRDFDLMSDRENVELGMTITGLGDETVPFEPGAPSNTRRVAVLEEAREAGVRTFVSLEPWIPGVTKPLQIIRKLAPFVDRWIVGTMNYCGVSREEYARESVLVKDLLDELGVPYWLKKEIRAQLPSPHCTSPTV